MDKRSSGDDLSGTSFTWYVQSPNPPRPVTGSAAPVPTEFDALARSITPTSNGAKREQECTDIGRMMEIERERKSNESAGT